jgi:hypothetical protein
MAADHMTADVSDGHPAMDYAAHQATYAMFIGLIKWGSIGVIFLVLLLAFFTL